MSKKEIILKILRETKPFMFLNKYSLQVFNNLIII